MVPMLIGIFAALSVFGFIYAIASRLKSRSTISERMDHVTQPIVTSPADMQAKTADANDTNEVISLDDSFNDNITRNLYLGGNRKRRYVRFYRFLLNLSIILPVFAVIYQVTSGSVTPKSLFQSLMIGGVLFAYVQFSLVAIREKRKNTIMKSMPQFFDLLVVCLEAGINFSSALPRVVKEIGTSDPLAQEFDQMHGEFLGGLGFKEVCERLARRCDVQDLSVIMNALIESEEMGTSLAHVLRIQSDELRDKLRQRAREKAHRIPIKLLFPMLMIFSTLFVIALGPVGQKLSDSMKDVKNQAAENRKASAQNAEAKQEALNRRNQRT